MSALRKTRQSAAGGLPPPEAFDYDDDVTAQAVEALAVRAKPILEKDEYIVVDGHIGNK
jgi:hypothetical protein